MSNAIANRYEVLSELGVGGMGKVFAVRDTVLQRDVALKLVRDQGPASLTQLKHEFWTMSRLRHPHTVEVHDFGILTDGSPYFTMEIVGGEGLDRLLPLPSEQARLVLGGICRALSFIHGQGYVHGDLKPENIRVLKDGTVKLMDFGLMERSGKVGGPIRGTLWYLAPEVARRGRIDPRADLYSLGAVAYHLLTGSPPYQATSTLELIKAHLEAPVPELSGVPEWEPLLQRLLAKDPLDRFQSAGEVLVALGFPPEPLAATLLIPPLLGRDLILSAFEADLGMRTGRVLCLEGSTGLGKSRLLEEFSLRGQLSDRASVLVRCQEKGAPYAPIIETLRSLLPLAPAAFTAHASVLRRLMPELRGGPDLEALEPAPEKIRLHAAILDLLAAIARLHCLVLLVDDAQWLDPPSRDLLEYVARHAPHLPLVLGLAGMVLEADNVESMILAPLSSTDATKMGAAMLGGAEPDFLPTLVELSAGNPGELASTLRQLVETGELDRRGGTWHLPADFSVASLPRGKQGIFGKKLQALTAPARELAQLLAVAGHRLPLELIAQLAGLGDERLFAALDELEREGVLEDAATGYGFKHQAFQALIYAEVAAELRLRMHGELAEALLPKLHAAPQDVMLLNAVAHHLRRGPEPRRAVPFLKQAGERNLELFANAAARDFFSEGLELLEEGDEPALRLSFCLGLGDVFRRLAETPKAIELLEAAVPLCEALGDHGRLAWVLTSLGKLHQVQGDYDQARKRLAGAVDMAKVAGSSREQARALATLGRVTYFQGDLDATIALYQEALALARSAHLEVWLAESLAFLGYLFSSDPSRQDEGLAYLQESLAIKKALGDKLGLNDTIMLLGNAYLLLGRYGEAKGCFEQCLELNREIGQRDEVIFSQINLGMVALETGELQEALRLSEEARELAVKTQSRYAQGIALTLAGSARIYLGQLDRGISQVEQGLALAREMNNRYLEATIGTYRADMLFQLGQYEEASSYATSALRLAEEGGLRELVPSLLTMQGLGLLMTGHREGARSALSRARKAALAANAKGAAAKAQWGLALLAAHSANFETAQSLAHEALQEADEIGARILSGLNHSLLGELLFVRERSSLAVEHLSKAKGIAEEIQCPLLHGRILRQLAEADPLRAETLRGMAQSVNKRLLAELEARHHLAFEQAMTQPWIPQPALADRTLDNRLGKLSQEMNDLQKLARQQDRRWVDLDLAYKRLAGFALRINQVHDLQLVLEMAMDLILEITEAERGFLLLYEAGDLQVRELRNFRNDPQDTEWDISRSIAEEVLRTEQPLCLKDAMTDERFMHSLSIQALNIRTVICVPLRIRNVVVGALYVDRQAIGNEFSERDLDEVTSLAALSSTAIENASLSREWQDKSRKFEMLYELSQTISKTLVMEEAMEIFIKMTLEVTQAERGFVLLWEHDRLDVRAAYSSTGEALDPASEVISRSVCQRVLDSNLPLCLTDLQEDGDFYARQSIITQNLRAVMCVPLIAKQHLLGLLYVDSRLLSHTFNAQDLSLFESVANHASIAIENASLYSQLSVRARELESLVGLYEEANLRASTDVLTSLHNRRFFLDQLNRDFAQARRYQRYLSVIMLDIDHFKSFNDTYGHSMGDQILVSVSTVLGQAVRLADVVARYGGEEFIVALPDTDLEGAVIVAERIRLSVTEIELRDHEGNDLRQVTVSLGVTTLKEGDERISELIDRADRALYVAKMKGRNQVQMIEE